MKHYQGLSPPQKKSAVDFMFQKLRNLEIFRNPNYNKPDHIKAKLAEIKTQIKFCGCQDCISAYCDTARKDSQIGEWILIQAIEAAEKAYYPDEGDLIIKVS